jgi:hypothetical protein
MGDTVVLKGSPETQFQKSVIKKWDYIQTLRPDGIPKYMYNPFITFF